MFSPSFPIALSIPFSTTGASRGDNGDVVNVVVVVVVEEEEEEEEEDDDDEDGEWLGISAFYSPLGT